jgi:hypothetical protein
VKYNLTLGCSELLEAGSTSDRGIAFLSESYGLGLAPELWSGPPTGFLFHPAYIKIEYQELPLYSQMITVS